MADTIVLTEIDINTDKAVKDIIDLKEEIAVLKSQTKSAKESQGELSEEYIKYAAALKSAQGELRTQENLLVKVNTANNAQAGSLDKLKAQLSVTTAQWSKLSEQDRLNSEIGKELTAQKLALTTQLKAEELATGDARRNVGNYEEATKSLKAQLKENTAALIEMKNAGNDNTEAYKKLVKETGELKDTMADTKAEINSFASDTRKLDLAIGVMTGIGAAAQVAESSVALLGGENEELTKSIQKMVAIQGLLNGVQEIGNALQKESAFMQGVIAIKTKVVTAAQWLWNAAMAANPVGLIVAGVAALGAGIALLTYKMTNSSKETENLTLKLKNLQAQSKLNAAWEDQYVKILQAKGSTDKDVTDQMINNNKRRQKAIEAEIAIMDSQLLKDGKKPEEYDKINEEYQNILEEGSILEIQRNKILEKSAQEKADAEIEADNKFTEANIKKAQLRYDNNKMHRDNAMKEVDINYNKQIATENLLYTQGVAIAKKQFDEKLITQEEYNNQVYALDTERKDNIIALRRDEAEKSVAQMNYELEVWKLDNKSKLDNSKELSQAIIDDEDIRLTQQTDKQKSILVEQLNDKLISQNDFNLAILQLEDDKNTQIADLNKQFAEQETQKKIEAAQTNFDNQQALFEQNALAQLDAQVALNKRKKDEELKNAEKIGADKDLINKKYAKADLVIEKAKTDAKLSLASGFASNIATIAGENTKVGKAAAVAAATINTYQAATGAYAAMAPIPIVGPALGIAAAAAAVVSGFANIKKILAVTPGTSSSSDSSSSSSTDTTATSSLTNSNASIGNGIVSRDTTTGTTSQTQNSIVLVVDDVTKAQNTESSKVKAGTI
jgi:hypothetical protein